MGGGISGRPGLHHDVHDAHALSFRQHHERIEIERDKPFAERVGHPPEADKRFLQRGDVGGLFAAEALKELGGLETVDHRLRP